MPTYCPSCQKDDRIYKVSTIYSGGISYGTFSSSEGPASGTSQTVLSSKLAPLPKPSISCFVFGCGGIMAASGTLVLLLGVSVLLMFAGVDASPGLPGMGPGIFNVGLGIFGLGVGLGIFLLGSLAVRRKMPAWTAAMQVWDRCYYCDRDGIVFDPTNGKAIPIDSFNNYLKIG